jgi:hypothetical protein
MLNSIQLTEWKDRIAFTKIKAINETEKIIRIISKRHLWNWPNETFFERSLKNTKQKQILTQLVRVSERSSKQRTFLC